MHWPFQGDIKFHRRVANFVYFAKLDEGEVVLRLSESNHRKREEIGSELDWMNYLAGKRIAISRPIATIAHSFVVELPGEKNLFRGRV